MAVPTLVTPLLTLLVKVSAARSRMTVSQTRSGRRPMRVETMLKKDNEGTLYRNWKDHIPGGLADKKKPTDFDPAALAKGTKVEFEHTDRLLTASEIAMDHLVEDPRYYDKLEKMEEGGAKHAGLLDVLKAPIPGTKDWFVNTGKAGLQGAHRLTGTMPARPGALRTAANSVAPAARASGALPVARGGVYGISEAELQRLGFGDLMKSGSAKKVEDLKKAAYRLQGHTEVQGLPIAIENRKGSVRSGEDPDGTPWRTKYKYPYGYLVGTKGNDDEEIDVYVGPNKAAPNAYVVHQHKVTGKGYDEDKVMLGFESEAAARAAYLEHYNKVGPKLLGPITVIAMKRLIEMLAQKKEYKKLATADISNNTLMTDRAGPTTRSKPGDVPDAMDVAFSKLKQAWDGVGSSGGPTGNRMAMLDMDEKPDRTKPGDVPSRDGTSPGAARIERHEAGPDFMTTLPTNGAMASSQTGATTRL